MRVLESLPARPLTDAEFAALNRADSLAFAVDVTDDAGSGDDGGSGDDAENDVAGLLLATDDRVAGLAHGADGWRVVTTVPLESTERFDAMRRCEEAVRAALVDE